MRIIKNNFTGGQVDQRVNFRNDLDLFANSCKSIENGVVVGLGGVKRSQTYTKFRTGIADYDDWRKGSFSIPYTSKETNAIYLISLRHSSNTNKLKPITSIGFVDGIISNSVSFTTEEIPHGDFVNPKYIQIGYELYIVDQNCPPLIVKLKDDGTFSVERAEITYGPFQDLPVPAKEVQSLFGTLSNFNSDKTSCKFTKTNFVGIVDERYVGEDITLSVPNNYSLTAVDSGERTGTYLWSTTTNGEFYGQYAILLKGSIESTLVASESSSVSRSFVTVYKTPVGGDGTWEQVAFIPDLLNESFEQVINIGDPTEVTTGYNLKIEYEVVATGTHTTTFRIDKLYEISGVYNCIGKVSSVTNASFVFTLNTDEYSTLPKNATYTNLAQIRTLGGVDIGVDNRIRIVGEFVSTTKATFDVNRDIGRLVKVCQNIEKRKVSIDTGSSQNATFYSDTIISYGVGALELRTQDYFCGNVIVQKSYNGGVTWEDIYSHSSESKTISSIANVAKVLDVTEYGVIHRIKLEQEMISQFNGTNRVRVSLSHKLGSFNAMGVITEVINSTTAKITMQSPSLSEEWTDRWAFGEFYIGNYPTCTTVHEERLYFAGCPNNSFRIWGSKIGDYLNFAEGTLDDDPITFQIATNDFISINWLVSYAKGMAIGCDKEVWTMGTNNSSKAISATNFNIKRVSAVGVFDTPPTLIGTRCIFIGADGQSLHEMVFSFNEEQVVTNELSFKAKDLFIDGVNSVACVNDTDNILYVGCDNGNIVSCVVNHQQEISGFSLLTPICNRATSRLSTIKVGNKDYLFFARDWLFNEDQVRKDFCVMAKPRFEDFKGFKQGDLKIQEYYETGTYSKQEMPEIINSAYYLDNPTNDGMGSPKNFVPLFGVATFKNYDSTFDYYYYQISSDYYGIDYTFPAGSIYARCRLFLGVDSEFDEEYFDVYIESRSVNKFTITFWANDYRDKVNFGERSINIGKGAYISSNLEFVVKDSDIPVGLNTVVADGVAYKVGDTVPAYYKTKTEGLLRKFKVETLDFSVSELGLNGNVKLTNPVIAINKSNGGLIQINSGGRLSDGVQVVNNNGEESLLNVVSGVRQTTLNSSSSNLLNEITPSKGSSVVITQDKPLPMEVIAISVNMEAKS